MPWLYNFIMRLSKPDIQLLQSSLVPHHKPFTILQLVQLFPSAPHIHQCFNQICLQFQTPQLSFAQIMQYLFGQLHQPPSISLQRVRNRSQLLRIRKKNMQQQFMVHLLGVRSDTERVQGLVIDQNTNTNLPTAVYINTHSTVREFQLSRQAFGGEMLRLHNNCIEKMAIRGNLLMYLNKCGEICIQTLPSKLDEQCRKESKYRPKVETSSYVLMRLPAHEQVLEIQATHSEEQWLVCSTTALTKIVLDFGQASQFLQPHIAIMQICKQTTLQPSTLIESVCQLCQPYIAIATNKQSILIINITDMRISNKIYHDLNFSALAFNALHACLVLGDFGGYLMTMGFSSKFGDVEEEGISYKKPPPAEHKIVQKSDMFETYYLPRNAGNKQAARAQTNPLSKQRKTPFSNIVQNVARVAVSLICTRERSVITYESRVEHIVKLWDLHSLRVYQKISLNVEIADMRVCREGLYLLSSEKGYLCSFGFENLQTGQNKKMPYQVLEAAIDSNVLFVHAANMSESIVYRVKLANKPQVSQHLYRASKNAEKSLKFAYYKNDLFLLNLTKFQHAVLQNIGIFGQCKQKIEQASEFESMIAYPHKKGIIMWNSHKLCIRCKPGIQNLVLRKFVKGQNIYSNFNEDQPALSKQHTYATNISFQDNIVKVRVLDHYITVITEEDKQSHSVYVIEQNTLTVCAHFHHMPKNIKVLQSNRHASLIYLAKEGNDQYQLYHHESKLCIWKSQNKYGYAIDHVGIVGCNEKQIRVMCVYKMGGESREEGQAEVLVQISKVIYEQQEKGYIDLGKGSTRDYVNHTQSIGDILYRSIYVKIKPQSVSNSQYFSHETANKLWKLSIADPLQKYSRQHADTKSAQAKILHYNKKDNNFIMGVMVQGTCLLYEADAECEVELVGVLDFNKESAEQGTGIKHVRYWNPQYKRQEEQLWEQTKANAIRKAARSYLDHGPLIARADSLRNTERKWNPEDMGSLIEIPEKIAKKSASCMKLPHKSDPKRINQILHKSNIHQQLTKKRSETALKSREIKQPTIDHKQIKALTSTIRLTKQTMYSDMLATDNTTVKAKSSTKLKTEQSQLSPIKQLYFKGSPSRRPRYVTEAIEHLQNSRLLERKLFPDIGAAAKRTQTTALALQKSQQIHYLLERQHALLQRSRANKP